MGHQNKTNKDLIKEISTLNQQITKLKKTKDKNKQELKGIKTLIDELPQAVYEIDKKGYFTFLNQTATEIWGFTKSELKNGLSSLQTLIPEDRPRAINNIGKLLSGKKLSAEGLKGYLAYETIRKKKDGTLFPVSISATPLAIDGQAKGEIGIYIDITERKQNEKVQQTLYNISKAANSNISLKELYPIIHKELHKIIDATNFYISLLDKKENKLYFPYYKDKIETFPTEGKDATGMISTYMIKNNKSLLLGSKQVKEMGSQGKIDISKVGVFSDKIHWLGVPLKVGDKVIGVMVVQSYTDPNLYNQKDLKLMEFVSEQVATAIERKRMEEELKRLAHHDPLTGTYNRGYGLELLQRQVKLAKRNKTSFLLAYTDLNNLKKINDEFGHEEGDKAIAKVANLFQSILREVDIIIRMGGDEFLLVFPESSLREVPIIEKRLYDKLARQNRVSNKPYKIGFSIGFSCYNSEHPKSIEDLMRIADQEMYKNKKR